MLIVGERVQQSLREELGVDVSVALLKRHNVRAKEVYIVHWLMERSDPKKPVRLTKVGEDLRGYCDKNSLPYLFPATILGNSSKLSPESLGVVGVFYENGLGSPKRYNIKDIDRGTKYLKAMKPYLEWFNTNK